MDGFYKFYIPTRGKRALAPFKDVPKSSQLSKEAVSSYTEYAGVLDDNTVLIDVDDPEQSKLMFKIVQNQNVGCRVIKTKRGMHFLFMNDGRFTQNATHKRLAIGLDADIKGCGKPSYEVLKTDGVEREVIYDVQPYEQAPAWLTPIRTNIDVYNLGDGDGRNDSLFRYILPLQKAGLNQNECSECIRLINQFVFKTPLTEKELSSILRDKAFGKPVFFNDRGIFQFDEFSRWFVENYHVIRLNGELYVYTDGIYQNGYQELEKAMIKEIPSLNITKRREVLAYIELIAPVQTNRADAHLIAFNNGVLNIITGELLNFSVDYIITNKIPHNWNPDAKSELLEKTMNNLACNDEGVVDLLYQAVGYSMYRRNELRKSFLLIGEKRNGKSTFLDMVNTMLGDQNISALDLSEIGEKFKTAELSGKLANIGDDIDDAYIPNSAVFKKVVSGSKITVERKGQDPFQMESYAKFFFSANSIPRIGHGEDNAAILDRLVIIPFDNTFDKNSAGYDPFLKYKLRDESVIEALIVKAIEGLRLVVAEQGFIEVKRVKDTTREYELANDPIETYFLDLQEKDYLNERISDVYRSYYAYCISNGMQAVSSTTFGRRIKKKFGLTVESIDLDGAKVRVYKKG